MRRTEANKMYLSVITLLELRFGLEKMAAGAKRSALSAWLSHDLPEQYKGRIVPVTAAIADDAGRLLAKAAASGFNITHLTP